MAAQLAAKLDSLLNEHNINILQKDLLLKQHLSTCSSHSRCICKDSNYLWKLKKYFDGSNNTEWLDYIITEGKDERYYPTFMASLENLDTNPTLHSHEDNGDFSQYVFGGPNLSNACKETNMGRIIIQQKHDSQHLLLGIDESFDEKKFINEVLKDFDAFSGKKKRKVERLKTIVLSDELVDQKKLDKEEKHKNTNVVMDNINMFLEPSNDKSKKSILLNSKSEINFSQVLNGHSDCQSGKENKTKKGSRNFSSHNSFSDLAFPKLKFKRKKSQMKDYRQ